MGIGTGIGLVLNATVLFLFGRHLWPRLLHRMRRRMEETERFRERQERSDH